MSKKSLGHITFLCGTLLIIAYWLFTKPDDIRHFGYIEDLGGIEVPRQIMAENYLKFSRPVFHTDSLMAPFGASIPFTTWSVEREGIGAFFWLLSPTFPFLWLYFLASLLLTYIGCGKILKKMQLPASTAWILSSVFTLFNLPRHFRMWHHFEHMTPHWIYLNFFYDAYIWQQAIIHRKLSLKAELWRLLILAGTFMTAGYYWGPIILLWGVVRISLLLAYFGKRKSNSPLEIDISIKNCVLPLMCLLVLFLIEVFWFYGLYEEVSKVSRIKQDLGWFAPIKLVFEPLWRYPLAQIVSAYLPLNPQTFIPTDFGEQMVTIGWIYWVPVFYAVSCAVVHIFRQRKLEAIILLAPFLLFLCGLLNFVHNNLGTTYQEFIRNYAPFMSYFRVASRIGLFLAPLLAAIIALSWPYLTQTSNATSNQLGWRYCLIATYFLSSLLELSWLSYPTQATSRAPASLRQLMETAKNMPGDTILDLPFCLAGGNGVCSTELCPHYPQSTAAHAFRLLHGKKIYGMYVSRAFENQCSLYKRNPFQGWFSAWQENRCFSKEDWDNLCNYLAKHPEISAILLYPDIWPASASTDCLAQFTAHLSAPLAEAEFYLQATRDPKEKQASSRVVLFRAQCKKKFSD